MNNVNYCRCNDVHLLKRNHHGIVCTKCNPELIQPLLVPQEIKAYRTWNFNVESGFVARSNGRIQGWNDFNYFPPPGFTARSLHSSNQPWNSLAICVYNNHIAPDPYCSCGYYAVKNFGAIDKRKQFSHDSTKDIVSMFDRNVISSLQSLISRKQQMSFANLYFHSPLLKTLEVTDFKILSEVSLKGKVIECEKGYRSERIEPKKFFLLVNFFELNALSEQLGNFTGKDGAETINSTIVWIDFLNNFLKGIMNAYGCDFELLVNVNKKNPIDSEMLNRAENKRRDAYGPSYLSFEKDLYINERLRGIADTVMISNKILKKQPFPDLEVLIDFEKKYLESDTGAQTYQRTTAKHLRTLQNRDINLSRIVRQNRHYRAWGLDNFRKYQEKIFAFGVLYLNIINNEIDYKEIINSDFSEVFGFKYNLFLDNYQTLEGFDPQTWFPLLSQNKNFPPLREKG